MRARSKRLAAQLVFALVLWSMSVVSLVGCTTHRAQRDHAVAPIDTRIIIAANDFGFRVFKAVAARDPEHNVIVGPASAAIGLAIAYDGASGRTAQEAGKTLGLVGLSRDTANKAYAAWLADLKSADPKVDLGVANSLWIRADHRVRPQFIDEAKRFFGAEVANLDFNRPDTLSTINDWVAKHTNEKITRAIEYVDPRTQSFLIDAMYFKGSWTRAFDSSKTRPHSVFFRGTGTSEEIVDVPMMIQTGIYRYLETDEFQAISLPYGDGRISMYVFLTIHPAGLGSFLATLNADRWEALRAQFADKKGEIWLPRFMATYRTDLVKPLTALGVRSAFDYTADFARMRSERDIFIQHVFHEAHLVVDEQGTEATVETTIEYHLKGNRPIPSGEFRMSVNHPFFFAITDDDSGSMLFMGAIIDPTTERRGARSEAAGHNQPLCRLRALAM